MKLRILAKHEKENTVVELNKAFCVIGRKGATLTLSDPRCSHQHVLLYEGFDGKLRLKDLQSTNGTQVNSEKITDCELNLGDEIKIGRTTLVLLDFIPANEREMTNSKKRLLKRQKKSESGTSSATIKEPGVVVQWPDNILALPKEAQQQFVDYVDEKGKQKTIAVGDLIRRAGRR